MWELHSLKAKTQILEVLCLASMMETNVSSMNQTHTK